MHPTLKHEAKIKFEFRLNYKMFKLKHSNILQTNSWYKVCLNYYV